MLLRVYSEKVLQSSSTLREKEQGEMGRVG